MSGSGLERDHHQHFNIHQEPFVRRKIMLYTLCSRSTLDTQDNTQESIPGHRIPAPMYIYSR